MRIPKFGGGLPIFKIGYDRIWDKMLRWTRLEWCIFTNLLLILYSIGPMIVVVVLT